ncbi:hypothetical protein DSA05_20195 [Salmonella enterica]|nr:hypothetical protein [Salmonella enterica]EBV5774546.1 hypothetical protein [Salmonella enterica subsp. enterica serovar Monophasic]ECS7596812.1 hypothetical protein [Salmonella enterica subsp. enterica serovar Norwich]HAC6493089.1 hypothetical protein [Salmonella enterica subsp. houtenae serovar 44:z36[z38]:-]EAP1745231.1 hypothetical protein [Salmonella enterica]
MGRYAEVLGQKEDHAEKSGIALLLRRLSTYTVIRSSNKILNMILVRSKEDPDYSESHVITGLGV